MGNEAITHREYEHGKDVPAVYLLSFFSALLEKYRRYREDNNIKPPLRIFMNPLRSFSTIKEFQINAYLHSISPTQEDTDGAGETLVFRFDVMYSEKTLDSEAMTNLLHVQDEIRRLFTHFGATQQRNFGMRYHATNASHPTFLVITSLSEAMDVDFTFGQIEQRVEIRFDYEYDDDSFKTDDINFGMIIGGKNEQRK